MPSEVEAPLPGGGRLAGLVELAGESGCVLYVHGFGSDGRGEKPAAVFAACARLGLRGVRVPRPRPVVGDDARPAGWRVAK